MTQRWITRSLLPFLTLTALGLSRPGQADVSPQVVEQGKAATALVETANGSASAFCISPSGYFVTNDHVVFGSVLVKLILNPGEKGQRSVNARVIRTDHDTDLALLKEDDPHPVTALALGSSADLRETMSVTTFGYPFGKDLVEGKEQYPSVTVSTGHITALRREGGALKEVQLDASLNPGNSGGPVVNEAGQVIGIVAAGIPGAALNFAIPVDTLRALLTHPDITFRPMPILAVNMHRPVVFRIGVSFPSGSPDGFAVSVTLTESGREPRTIAAGSAGPGLFTARIVPVLARPGVDSVPPDVSYRVSVMRANKVVGEATGTLQIVTVPGAPAVSPAASRTPGVVLPPLHPSEETADKSVFNLPSLIDEVAVGGGGRYLILSLKSLQKLAVFDFNAGRIVRYISVDSSDYHFAAGGQSLVIILDDRKVIERWNLEKGTREIVAAEPNWAAVRDMKMGSASAGPVVIGLNDSSTKWLSVATLTPVEIEANGRPYGGGGWGGFPWLFRLSPDGAVLVGWINGLSPRPLDIVTFHGAHADIHSASVEGYNGRYYTVGSDGLLIYTTVGIDTQDMIPVDPNEFGGHSCLPVQGGSFFLTIDGPSISLYTTTDKRLLLTLPKLEELGGDYWDIEKQIFLVPAAKLLVTIPSSRDRLFLRRFDLVAQLNKSGIDYLFVSTIPPAVFHKGQIYAYQMDVKSKHGGVKYILDSGPPGMTLSKTGRLQWAVSPGETSAEEHVIVRVQDSTGQEIYHTFRIAAG